VTDPAFAYDLAADDSGYRLRIEMSFSGSVGLARAIHGFRDPALLAEFNPAVDPVSNTPKDGKSYRSTMSFRTFGLRTKMVSECAEEGGVLEGFWKRRCRLDTSREEGGRYMDWKSDEVSCVAARAGSPLRCTLEIAGRIKDVLFMKSPVLTVKAKHRALLNWGMFWAYAENGSVSTALSNPIFERSPLRAELDSLLERGLRSARERRFSFRARASFPARDIR
jgi:hypothetical protein